MRENRNSLLKSICELVGYQNEPDVSQGLPLKLLLDINTALKASPQIKLNQKVNTLLKVALRVPMMPKEVEDAIKQAKN